MKYIIIIDNGLESENYYFKNKKNAIELYKKFKKYLNEDIEIYKIEKIEIKEKK